MRRGSCSSAACRCCRPPRTPWERQDEHTPRPRDPRRFGAYTWGKCLQEELVEREAAALGIATRIIRPGALVDSDDPSLPGLMGRRLFGRWHLGLGAPRLPIAVCEVMRAAGHRLVRHALRRGAAGREPARSRARDATPRSSARCAAGWDGRMVWVPDQRAGGGDGHRPPASPRSRTAAWPERLAAWSILRPRRFDTRLSSALLEAAGDASGITFDAGRHGLRHVGSRSQLPSHDERTSGAQIARLPPSRRASMVCRTDAGAARGDLLAVVERDRGLIGGDQLAAAAWNLAHVPLFAVLAMCWVKTLGNRDASPAAIGAGFLAATLCAVLDEWHQSFVPGRMRRGATSLWTSPASAAMLVILVSTPRRRTRQRAQGSRQRAPTLDAQDVPSTLVHDR